MGAVLRPGTPREAGMSAEPVGRIVDLAAGWVAEGITPALVVLVARRGVIVLHEAFGRLGPEPLESGFSVKRLAEMLAGRRGRIKPLLLDQSFIAGLGNIYADEALFEARIHPLTRAKKLSYQEVDRLHQAMRMVLRQATANRGTSISNYVDPSGQPGFNQYSLRLPRHEGEPCTVCNTPIERLHLGGRSTYFCPKCQAYPGRRK